MGFRGSRVQIPPSRLASAKRGGLFLSVRRASFRRRSPAARGISGQIPPSRGTPRAPHVATACLSTSSTSPRLRGRWPRRIPEDAGRYAEVWSLWSEPMFDEVVSVVVPLKRTQMASRVRALTRLGVVVACCACGQTALSDVARAQDSSGRVADSVRRRQLLRCDEYGTVLQRRELTRAVVQALGTVSQCPEGPDFIANLWAGPLSADLGHVSALASVSGISNPRVARALIRTLSDRQRPTAVRLQVLTAFLSQLTTEYGSISILTAPGAFLVVDPAEQRSVGRDSTRYVSFGRVAGSHTRPAQQLNPALRAEIVTAIARIADDASEDPDLRMAAAGVRKRLPDRAP